MLKRNPRRRAGLDARAYVCQFLFLWEYLAKEMARLETKLQSTICIIWKVISGVLNRVLQPGGSAPRSILFVRKGPPFVYKQIVGTPSHTWFRGVASLSATVKAPSLKYEQTQQLFHSHKTQLLALSSLFTEKNTDFPTTLSRGRFSLAREERPGDEVDFPTLLYTWCLKKVPLSGGASP